MEGGGLVLALPCEGAEHHDHGHTGHGGGHEGADHRPLSGGLGTGGSEIWIGSPSQAIFEVRQAEEGAPCTGFGYLGLSRTPRLFICGAPSRLLRRIPTRTTTFRIAMRACPYRKPHLRSIIGRADS
jgi:hypothetical protein